MSEEQHAYTLINYFDQWWIHEDGQDFAHCNSEEQALRIIEAMMQRNLAEYDYTCDAECQHRWANANPLLEFCLECGGTRTPRHVRIGLAWRQHEEASNER